MDFHSLNRKELQALCKTHKIPANLSNLEMAKRLAECFKEIENSSNQELVSGQDESACETESANMVVNKKVKKVRFSPQHELIEFTRSPGIEGRIRRNSVSIRTSISSFENADTGRNADGQGRFTRSRGIVTEELILEKKRGRKGVKCSEQRKIDSTIDNGGLGDGCVDGAVRVLRSRGKKIAEGIDIAKGNENAFEGVDDEKSTEEIVDKTVRVTRSRSHKLTEGTSTETKRVRKLVEIVDDVAFVSGEANAKRVATRHSSRKGVEINGKRREENLEGEADAKRVATRSSSRKRVEINGKRREEILEGEANAKSVAASRSSRKGVEINGKQREEVLEGEADAKRVVTRLLEKTKKIEEENQTIAPGVLVRRSKRNATTVCHSQIFSKASQKSEMSLPTDVNTENGIIKGKCDGCVVPPNKPEVRRSNRSKDLVEVHENGRSVELKEESENTRVLRSSGPQSIISGRVPKNQKKMPQPPIETMRPSRRKTLITLNCEADKHLSKEFPVKGPSAILNNTRRSGRVASMRKPVKVIDERGGDSIVHQRKQEIEPISEEVAVKAGDDLGSLKQSVEECINEKSVSIAEVQLPLSDGALSSCNQGLSTDTKSKSKSITRNIQREEQVVSIADTSKSTDMDLFGGNVLENTVNLGKDISGSNIKDEEKVDSVEFIVQDIIKQGITNVVKNQFEVQLCCQNKSSNCVNMDDNQISCEDINVSGIEGFAETISSVNSDILGDLEVTEHTQTCSIVVGEVDGISVQDNLDLVESGQANVISLSNACDQINIDPMEASNSTSDDKKEDRASKAHDVDASESCEKDNESALQLMDPSIAMARSIELEEKGIFPEFEDIEKGGCLKVGKTGCNDDDEFSMPDLFGGERRVGMTPQDRRLMSAGYMITNSDEQVMEKESLAVSPIITSPNITNIFLEIDIETRNTCQGEESYIDKNTHYDVAEIDEGGSSDCQGDMKFALSNTPIHQITPQDREILSGENYIKHQRVEGDGASARKDSQSESANTNEGGFSQNHKATEDENFGFSIINLFDAEESDKITPQVREFSGYDLRKCFNEQVVFDDSHAVSTTYNEVKISAGASSLKKIIPSEPNTSPKSQGDGSIIVDNEAVPVAIGDEVHRMFNLADEHTTEYTRSQVEPNRPLAIPTATEGPKSWNDASETTGSAMCISQTFGKGITSPVLDDSNTDEDDGKNKYELADEFMRDADISMDSSISKLRDGRFCELEFHYTEETEYQPNNLHEKHIVAVADIGEKPNDVKPRQSLTAGIESNNLFETTMNGFTGLNSLTNMKEKEVEGEIASESATTHEIAPLPRNYKEVSISNNGVEVTDRKNEMKDDDDVACEAKIWDEKDDNSRSVRDISDEPNCTSEVENLKSPSVGDTLESPSTCKVTYTIAQNVDNALPAAEVGFSVSCTEFDVFSNSVMRIFKEDNENVDTGISEPRTPVPNSVGDHEKNSKEVEISIPKLHLEQEVVDSDNDATDYENCGIEKSASGTTLLNLEGEHEKNNVLETEEKPAATIVHFPISELHLEEEILESNNDVPTAAFGGTKVLKESDVDDTITEYIDEHTTEYTRSQVEQPNSPSVMPTAIEGQKAWNDASETTGSAMCISQTFGEGITSPVLDDSNTDEDDDEFMRDAGISMNSSISKLRDERFCELEFHYTEETEYQPKNLHEKHIVAHIGEKPNDVKPSQSLTGIEPNNLFETTTNGVTGLNRLSNMKEKVEGEIASESATTHENAPLPRNCKEVSISIPSSAMHIFEEDNENVDTGISEAGTPVPNSVGHHENNSKEVEISIPELPLEQKAVDSDNDVKEAEEKPATTIVQFPISELHLEEEILESNNDVPTAAFGGTEVLKESDVGDTITEYIDSELTRMNEMATCKDGLQTVESQTECKRREKAICVDDVHVGGEEQTEEMLLKESPRGPDPAYVDLVGDSGGNDALLLHKEDIESAEDGHVISTSGELCMTAKKNARTILIHGTPSKAMAIPDMKENAPTFKRANLGDFTAVRPAKRKALQDVQWK